MARAGVLLGGDESIPWVLFTAACACWKSLSFSSSAVSQGPLRELSVVGRAAGGGVVTAGGGGLARLAAAGYIVVTY